MTQKFNRRILLPLMVIIQLSSTTLHAQSPYNISWKKDAPVLGSGLITAGLGLYLKNNIAPPSLEDLSLLDANSINSLDRSAVNNYSTDSGQLSDVLQVSAFLSPLLFLTKEGSRKHFGQILIMYSEALTITNGLTLITKSTVQRYRPFAYNESLPLDIRMRSDALVSFPSGHTSIAAVNCFFGAKVFSDLYPDSRWKPYVWGAAATIPAFMGYLRIRAGQHFTTDVMTGYALGAITGILVPHFHKNQMIKEEGLSLELGVGSMRLTYLIQ